MKPISALHIVKANIYDMHANPFGAQLAQTLKSINQLINKNNKNPLFDWCKSCQSFHLHAYSVQ